MDEQATRRSGMKSSRKLGATALMSATIMVFATFGASPAFGAVDPDPKSPLDELSVVGEPAVPVLPIDDHVIVNGQEYEVDVLPGFDSSHSVKILGDQSAQRSALASECATDFVVPAVGTHYSVQKCAVIGLNYNTTIGYSWHINPFSNGRICGDGKGYIVNNAGVRVIYWVGMGCGADGGGSGIPWGAVAANKQMRGYSIGLGGWAGKFF